MDKLKKGFENTLKIKLAQKAIGTCSEEAFLSKNVRYFDSDNDGSITMIEWFKAIEKVGVIVPSMDDLEALFRIYDINVNNKIDYREFSHMLYSQEKPEYLLTNI